MKISSIVRIILIFAALGSISGYLLVKRDLPLTNIPAAESPVLSVKEPFPQAEQVFFEPRNLSIPKIGVNAVIEPVGEDAEGKMDVPKGVFNAGWYSLGFKPGEKGSAVMAGHLDTVTGAPAVFYNIGRLQPGDEVIVTDRNGKNLVFEVTDVQSYPFDKVPLGEIFGRTDKPKLNLITCEGTWNTGTRNYSNRLVVYTELKTI